MTIILSGVFEAIDDVGLSAAHAYLYAWPVVAYDFAVRDATFLVCS